MCQVQVGAPKLAAEAFADRHSRVGELLKQRVAKLATARQFYDEPCRGPCGRSILQQGKVALREEAKWLQNGHAALKVVRAGRPLSAAVSTARSKIEKHEQHFNALADSVRTVQRKLTLFHRVRATARGGADVDAVISPVKEPGPRRSAMHHVAAEVLTIWFGLQVHGSVFTQGRSACQRAGAINSHPESRSHK